MCQYAEVSIRNSHMLVTGERTPVNLKLDKNDSNSTFRLLATFKVQLFSSGRKKLQVHVCVYMQCNARKPLAKAG